MMSWIEEVKNNIRKKRAILFDKHSELLSELRTVIDKQNRRTVVLWAFYFAEQAVDILSKKYPDESAPYYALQACKLWASGEIKMPVAKREILACHGMAKSITSPEDIALCHAIGQALSCVHTKGHALGFPIYELTSIVCKYGIENCKEIIEKRVKEYTDILLSISGENKEKEYKWADFMLK